MREWQSDLSKSALIVWDMQYGICTKAFNIKEITPNIKSLVDAMHALQRPVIYSQATGLSYEYQSAFTMYRMRKRGIDPKTMTHMKEGTRDWQLIDELKPEIQDIIIKKYTPSLFVGSVAEAVLNSSEVDTVIITGVSTEIGVETTARHAACLGFVPLIAEDAVGGPDKEAHDSALSVMRKLFEVRSTQSILVTLKK